MAGIRKQSEQVPLKSRFNLQLECLALEYPLHLNQYESAG